MESEVKVKSLYKAVKLLDCFTNTVPERGISEMAEMTGMLKSTVHNIVTTFEKCKILEKNPENNKYRLGLKILQLGNNFLSTNDLRSRIKPYLTRISERIAENIYFVVLTEDESLYLDAIYPSMFSPGRTIIGTRAPLFCTGVGKAMLANLAPEDIKRILSKGMPSFTPNTITDEKMMMEELTVIRQRGYAIDNMEHEYGIKCVAVPLFNCNGKVMGAISVSGPSLRFSDETILRYADILRQASEEIKGIFRYD
jgi:DNA-binding IclR family transcriptional regulator